MITPHIHIILYHIFPILFLHIAKYLNQSGSRMAPILSLGYFLIKRKTRVFPYFIGLYELFTTTLLIFLTTATWKSQDSIFSIISIIRITIISLFYGHRGTSTISIISTIINIYYSINVVKMWSNLSNDILNISAHMLIIP